MYTPDGHTRTCGLIGNPVAHTLSPLIQNHMARATGQNLVYLPYPVAAGDLGAAVRGALALDFLGLNVTVPYKSDVIAYLAEIDPLAERIGAVNTLVRCPGGYRGYNTDMPGLYRAMVQDGVETATEMEMKAEAEMEMEAEAEMEMEVEAATETEMEMEVEAATEMEAETATEMEVEAATEMEVEAATEMEAGTATLAAGLLPFPAMIIRAAGPSRETMARAM